LEFSRAYILIEIPYEDFWAFGGLLMFYFLYISFMYDFYQSLLARGAGGGGDFHDM